MVENKLSDGAHGPSGTLLWKGKVIKVIKYGEGWHGDFALRFKEDKKKPTKKYPVDIYFCQTSGGFNEKERTNMCGWTGTKKVYTSKLTRTVDE